MPNSYFIWNGRSSEEFGIRIEKYPNMNRPARKYTSTDVPGRNGSIYQFQDAYKEVVQKYEIFAGEYDKDVAVDTFYPIVEWLHSADDFAVLEDSYDSRHYRLAVFVDATDVANKLARFGKATISFRCKPQRFLKTDPVSKNTASGSITLNNPTNNEAFPLIELTSVGYASLFTTTRALTDTRYEFPQTGTAEITAFPVNYQCFANVMVNSDEKKVYNTYSTVGLQTRSSESYAVNTDIGGDFAVHESNADVTYNSKTCKVAYSFLLEADPKSNYVLKPWKCKKRIGDRGNYQYVDADPDIYVLLLDSNGKILRFIDCQESGSDFAQFETTASTKYMVLCFGGGDGTRYYASIQIHKGTEITPYISYENNIATVKLNGILLTLKPMTDRLTVDCESEDVYRGSDNLNTNAAFTDEYGEPCECFKLLPGRNVLEFNGNHLTGITVNPNYWEL